VHKATGVAILVGALATGVHAWLGAAAGEPAAEESWKVISPYFAPPEEFAGDMGPHKPVLKFYDGTPVKTKEDWQRRRKEILAKWHKMMGPWPELIAQPKIKYLEKEQKEGYTQHAIQLEVAPGWKPWKS